MRASAPDGGLVVACHSGGPDWGSGPTGKGKLFKITYTDPKHPQPVFVWPTGRARCASSSIGPCRPSCCTMCSTKTKLRAAEYVRAGDRFESLCARLRGRAGAKDCRRGSMCRCARPN